MATTAKTVEARQKQSDTDKKSTLELLKSKKRSTDTFTLYIDTDDGQVEVEMTFQSIGTVEYDKLVGKYPPTNDQRLEGQSFDIDKFAPALIAKCSVDPEMDLKDAQELWNSPEWSRGDLMALFRRAVELNNRGVDIPFSERG